MKEYQLSDRTLVPAVGFGTYLADETAAALPLAVEVGYRYFDTAAYYFNEELVGKTLKNSGLKREEYQIASKVWHTELGYEKTKASFFGLLETVGLRVFGCVFDPLAPHQRRSGRLADPLAGKLEGAD